MIIKTDKAGKELESWPGIEEAAKAIKVSPAVLKKHLKGRPPKLDGFKFVEKTVPETLVMPENIVEGESTLKFKTTDKTESKQTWELAQKIDFKPATPESFDGSPLNTFIADEAGMFAAGSEEITDQDLTEFMAHKPPPVMLDEFGDVIPPIPEAAFGCPPIPPDLSENEITENDLLEIATNATSGMKTVNKEFKETVYHVDFEQVADYLRTPLERRLHEIKRKK